jgi:hypothetical protein
MGTGRFLSRGLLGGLRFLLVVLLLGATAWAFGALLYDFPAPALRLPVAIVYVGLVLVASVALRRRVHFAVLPTLGFILVLVAWRSLRPSNERSWQPDVDRTAWAEVNGDDITLHNVRNCDYRTETDFTPRWEKRTVRLSQMTGVDVAITYWGSPWMAHPIMSFQFADAAPICFSIETRKEVGESYSAVGGLYRQFELIYVVADEQDVIRLRTNYRQGEDVFLYSMAADPVAARSLFLEYIRALNYLRNQPVWYNAVTTNCTTAIRLQRDPSKRAPWDWRMLANGKADEMLFERGAFVTGGLSFPELKRRVHINATARSVPAEQFSQAIRRDLPRR